MGSEVFAQPVARPRAWWAAPRYAVWALVRLPALRRAEAHKARVEGVADRAATEVLGALGGELVESGLTVPELTAVAEQAVAAAAEQPERDKLLDSAFDKEQKERKREHTVLEASLGPLRDRETRLLTRVGVFEQELKRKQAQARRVEIELRNLSEGDDSPRRQALLADQRRFAAEVDKSDAPVKETLGKLERARVRMGETLEKITHLEAEGRRATESHVAETETRPARTEEQARTRAVALRALAEHALDLDVPELLECERRDQGRVALSAHRQQREELLRVQEYRAAIDTKLVRQGLLMLGAALLLLMSPLGLLLL